MAIVRIGPETLENAIATFIDVASILFAYQIGIARFSLEYGMVYAAFDAFIVVWMRRPIAQFARRVNPFRAAQAKLVAETLLMPVQAAGRPNPAES